MTEHIMKQPEASRWRLAARLGIAIMAGLLAIGITAACGDDDDDDGGDDNGNGDATQVTRPAADELFIQLDTVRGPTNLPEEFRGDYTCVQLSRFPQGSEIVWRFKILDPSTGESLGDTDMETVQITLPTGETLDARFGPHPRDEDLDQFWTASWDIPLDYPTGTFDYELTAVSVEGLEGTYEQFGVPAAQLTIVPQNDTVVPEEGES